MKKTLNFLATLFALITTSELNAQTCCAANAGVDKIICCPGNSVTIGGSPASTLSGGGCDSIIYRWIPPTGLSDCYYPNPIASPSTTTNYTLLISYYNSSTSDTCCKSSDVVKVTVNTGCCRIGGETKTTTLPKDIANIYPIPSSQLVNFELLNELEDGEVVIYDTNNQVVWKKEKVGTNEKIIIADLKGLNNGIYLAIIKEKGETIYSKKIVLQD